MPESDHPTSRPTSDRPSSDSPIFSDRHDLLDPTVPLASDLWPSAQLPSLEHDRQVLAWLQCSPELGHQVTGYICDALLDWSLHGGRPYPDMALPDAGSQCDHLQALREIIERLPQRVLEAETVAEKLELGRAGRLLSRASWAAFDPQAVRDAVDRELLMTMPWLAGPPAPYVLPDGRVL